MSERDDLPGAARPVGADMRQNWDAQGLWRAMLPHLPGLTVEVVERVESTNAELMARLRSAASVDRGGDRRRAADLHPVLLVAADQTRGRGRMGRAWVSEPGASLTFSLSMTLRRPDWSGLSLALGVAVVQAFDPQGVQLGLKWPNDVLQRDAGGFGLKLGGILVESLTVGPERVAVMGIGLNILPQRQADGLPPMASLNQACPGLTPQLALARLAPVLATTLETFDREGFGPFAAPFGRLDLLHGLWIDSTDPQCPRGVADGVAEDGALRVRHDGGVYLLRGGEISVRPAGANPGTGA